MTNLAGDTAEIEMFANLPIVATIWLSCLCISRKVKPYVFVLIGVLGAICFLFKAVYLGPLIGTVATLFLKSILNKGERRWRTFIFECLAITAGFIIVLASYSIYLLSNGLWERFLLVFQLGLGYVNQKNSFAILPIFYIPLLLLGSANCALLVIGLIGFVRCFIFLPKSIHENKEHGLVTFLLAIWLFSSIISSGFSKYAFFHYALLLVPPFSLFAGKEISELWQRTRVQFPSTSIFHVSLLPGVLTLAILGNMVLTSQDYLGGYLSYRDNRISRMDFIRYDTQQGIWNATALEVADYIQKNTNANDKIFLWSDITQIYYYSDRESSSDVIWPIYVEKLGSPQRVFTQKPMMIVIDTIYNGMSVPDWLEKQLLMSYRLETTIDGFQIYRRSK
jgi:hypothetical protein